MCIRDRHIDDRVVIHIIVQSARAHQKRYADLADIALLALAVDVAVFEQRQHAVRDQMCIRDSR